MTGSGKSRDESVLNTDRRVQNRKTPSDWGRKLDEIRNFSFRVVLRRETGEYVGICDEIPRIAVADYDPRKALAGVRALVENIATSCRHSSGSGPVGSW